MGHCGVIRPPWIRKCPENLRAGRLSHKKEIPDRTQKRKKNNRFLIKPNKICRIRTKCNAFHIVGAHMARGHRWRDVRRSWRGGVRLFRPLGGREGEDKWNSRVSKTHIRMFFDYKLFIRHFRNRIRPFFTRTNALPALELLPGSRASDSFRPPLVFNFRRYALFFEISRAPYISFLPTVVCARCVFYACATPPVASFQAIALLRAFFLMRYRFRLSPQWPFLIESDWYSARKLRHYSLHTNLLSGARDVFGGLRLASRGACDNEVALNQVSLGLWILSWWVPVSQTMGSRELCICCWVFYLRYLSGCSSFTFWICRWLLKSPLLF